MIDANNPRMEPPRAEVQRMNYICTKEKFMTKDWLKEYAPRTPSELVLQKPKLDQLNAWLKRASTWVGMVRSCSVPLFYHFLRWVWEIKSFWVSSYCIQQMIFNPLHSHTYDCVWSEWHRLKIHPLLRFSSIFTIFVDVYGDAPNLGRVLEHTECEFLKPLSPMTRASVFDNCRIVKK